MKNFILAITLVLGFSSCSQKHAEPKINFEPPKYVEQMSSSEQEEIANLGGLYNSTNSPLFSDTKAMRINDIVTVLITEKASSSSKGSKSLQKSDSSTLNPLQLKYGGKNNGVNTAVQDINNGIGIGLGFDGKRGFDGKGENSRTESFDTTISARVVKVMSNGNYFIEGSREILIDGEKQIIQISGVIRPYDINLQNTIKSTMIADAKILYKTQGDINKTTKKGWASRFLDIIWPF